MPDSDVKLDVKWAIALLILAMLVFSAALASSHAPPNDWWTPYESYPATGDENITAVTGQFLSGDPSSKYAGAQGTTRGGMPLLAPFEILSVLLLAALIGAVAIAVREPGERGPPGGMR